MPALETTGIRKFYNGPESFTPDNQFLLGEVPGLRGFFVGAGFNSVGIASAGGAGRALAEWIVEGSPTSDLVGVDVRRFAPYTADNDWLRSRVAEVLGLHYEIPWPLREPVTARDVRTSPLHERLAEHGAHNGSRMGWERPLYFVPSGSGTVRRRGRRPHLDQARLAALVRCRAARDAARRSRCSTRRRSRSTSSPVPAPQRRCSGSARPTWTSRVDHCVYTPFLNARATYEADLTVTRVARGRVLAGQQLGDDRA